MARQFLSINFLRKSLFQGEQNKEKERSTQQRLIQLSLKAKSKKPNSFSIIALAIWQDSILSQLLLLYDRSNVFFNFSFFNYFYFYLTMNSQIHFHTFTQLHLHLQRKKGNKLSSLTANIFKGFFSSNFPLLALILSYSIYYSFLIIIVVFFIHLFNIKKLKNKFLASLASF